MAERQFTKLFSVAKGIIRRRVNLLEQPEDSLTDGENFDISGGEMLKTRRGRLFCSKRTELDCSLPDGDVKILKQVRFPTNEKTFLVAQVGSKIYACAAALPVLDGTAEWTEIYDLSLCTGFARGVCTGGDMSCAFHYAKTLLTGGTSAALDSVDGDLLSDGDRAIVFVDGGTDPNQVYIYVLDASSSLSESSPNVITPDNNPGTKRWILAASPRRMHEGSAAPTVNDDAGDGYRPMDIWSYDGDVWICADNTSGAAVWLQIATSSLSAATTVTDETSFGISSAVGTSTNYAREDHTHGTPANPVTTHESTYDHPSYDTHVAASAPHSGHEETANKGVANGYAGLNASGYVPADQLGSGTPDGTKVLYDNNSWAVPPGASGGEANTASNQGGGQGVYKQKTGVDLEFYTLNSDQVSESSDVITIDRIDELTQAAVTAPASPSSDRVVMYLTASGTSPSRTITHQAKFEDGSVAIIGTTVV